MIGKNRNHKSMTFTALRILGNVVVVALQVIASFASDSRGKPRYTAGKAQQLYEEGAISGTELARHIHGE
ncbi:hypothetical protein Lbir_0235 [Legionella birminghamensis]|uniref:Uncharacterized protein n=1 Tax=Legionella birminghamensis TaxID=28083 RepID=A0A378IBL7_9GAMM|nr:hypothetical protein [Legionella birminghamensis]KTC76166.1 hypothetical protein Lbir_0235 [Legionella birminghamensis]STX32210.1 Uncharacterised protein [Legionella birminghamensis]